MLHYNSHYSRAKKEFYKSRGKLKLEELPCEPFLERFIFIFRAFHRGKQVGEKRGRFQNVVDIAHKAVVLILISL